MAENSNFYAILLFKTAFNIYVSPYELEVLFFFWCCYLFRLLVLDFVSNFLEETLVGLLVVGVSRFALASLGCNSQLVLGGDLLADCSESKLLTALVRELTFLTIAHGLKAHIIRLKVDWELWLALTSLVGIPSVHAHGLGSVLADIWQ